MYTFHLLESEWHVELYVGGSIGIVCQFVVVVETVVLCTESKSLMPCHAAFFPFLEPIEFCSRLYEELHLHLLELAHTENKLACYYLIAECLSYLCYSKRNLHASGLL